MPRFEIAHLSIKCSLKHIVVGTYVSFIFKQDNEPTKPIILVLTKYDLVDMLEEDERVDEPQIRAKKRECGFTGSAVTSAKEWEDLNVHNASNRTLIAAYLFKYMLKEDDTDAEPGLE